ncbi:MAG: sulfatase-like hydrolase/transferase [Sporolactobacillus sp.]|nr:sulfatase-like hydrolase/transferase [Sporolactobacillus sp.]
MDKPNIIFLMTDQQRWDCIHKFNSYIRTPSIDLIAKKGITFSQATCQCPMCIPSRNSMMFGLYPSQLGVRTNAGGLFLEDKVLVPPLPEILYNHGYKTAGFGKTHWNHGVLNREPPTRGFEFRVEGQPSSSACYESGAIMMDEVNPEGLRLYFEETKDFGEGEENAKGYVGCTSHVEERNHRDGFIAEQCINFLNHYEEDGRPLFLYLSFIKPHAGFNVPKAFEDLYDINNIPDMPQPPWTEEPDTHLKNLRQAHPYWQKKYNDWHSTWAELSPSERKRTTLRYWANCTWLDSYFGQILKKLNDLGKLKNSLIIYASDHGEMLGERRDTFSKYCLYDSSVRVPLILSGTYILENKRGVTDERPAELVDLVPTIMNAAGIERNPLLVGLDLLSDQQRLGSFAEFHGGGSEKKQPAPAYMWRKKGWKLILYLKEALTDGIQNTDKVKGELYNLKEDPGEWNNIYYDERCAPIREKMKTELLMHLACSWAKAPFFYDRDGYQKIGGKQGIEVYRHSKNASRKNHG